MKLLLQIVDHVFLQCLDNGPFAVNSHMIPLTMVCPCFILYASVAFSCSFLRYVSLVH